MNHTCSRSCIGKIHMLRHRVLARLIQFFCQEVKKPSDDMMWHVTRSTQWLIGMALFFSFLGNPVRWYK